MRTNKERTKRKTGVELRANSEKVGLKQERTERILHAGAPVVEDWESLTIDEDWGKMLNEDWEHIDLSWMDEPWDLSGIDETWVIED